MEDCEVCYNHGVGSHQLARAADARSPGVGGSVPGGRETCAQTPGFSIGMQCANRPDLQNKTLARSTRLFPGNAAAPVCRRRLA